jgi:ribose transport system ATP-binding protein
MGVATVFQEFSLAPTLTVAENIFLGRYMHRGPFVDWVGMRREAARVLEISRHRDCDPDRLVSELSVAEQQLVEIAKAISMDATLLILDEPSTALGEQEIVALHGLSAAHEKPRRRDPLHFAPSRRSGGPCRYRHDPERRSGRLYADGTRLDVHDIVSKMVGEDIDEHYPKERNATDEVLLASAIYGLTGVRGAPASRCARARSSASAV